MVRSSLRLVMANYLTKPSEWGFARSKKMQKWMVGFLGYLTLDFAQISWVPLENMYHAWKRRKEVISPWVFIKFKLKMVTFLVNLLSRSLFDTAPCKCS